jgi:hypothetical protein
MPQNMLQFTLPDGASIDVDAGPLVIAGWSGRDRGSVEAYVAELVGRGFRAPSSIPSFYRAAPALATQSGCIDVLGSRTSGEVEVVLVGTADGILVALGSDHTDRETAPQSVAHAKQLCAKPVARQAWRYEDVLGHWDRLELHAWIDDDTARGVAYQSGDLSAIMGSDDLAAELGGALDEVLTPGMVLFCGTLPVIGAIRPAALFRMELRDPVCGRAISHAYSINVLPVVT